MERLKKHLKLKLRTKITFYFIAFILISVTCVGIAAAYAQYNALIDDTGKRLSSLAYYAASHIDGDNLNQIRSTKQQDKIALAAVEEELRLVLESANKIPVSQISEFLATEGKRGGRYLKAVYAYTLWKDGDQVLYGTDAFNTKEKKIGFEFGLQNKNEVQVKDVTQIYSGVPYFASKPYSDEQGVWITGYARVLDSNDQIAGVVCVDASIDFIYNKLRTLMIQIAQFGVGLLIVASLIGFMLSKRITNPLTVLIEGTHKIGSGDLTHHLCIETGDEIEELAEAFNFMSEELKKYIENLRITTSEKEKIESELQIANKIQTSMLPRIFPAFPNRTEVSLYALMDPAKEVGGDFYDFFFIDESRMFFVLGDVSGKGVPAALFMVITKSLIKTQALANDTTDQILYKVNNILCSDNEEMMFVTVFLGILDVTTGEMKYANAGHNPPLVHLSGNPFEYIKPHKSFVVAGIENTKYVEESMQLSVNDAIFIYSDGVTEAMNIEDKQFSEAKLLECLSTLGDSDEAIIVHQLQSDIKDFVKDAPQSDDITMLVIRYHGPNSSKGEQVDESTS